MTRWTVARSPPDLTAYLDDLLRTLRAELTESLIRMSGQLTVMRAVAERADPTVAKMAAALRVRYTPNTPTSA